MNEDGTKKHPIRDEFSLFKSLLGKNWPRLSNREVLSENRKPGPLIDISIPYQSNASLEKMTLYRVTKAKARVTCGSIRRVEICHPNPNSDRGSSFQKSRNDAGCKGQVAFLAVRTKTGANQKTAHGCLERPKESTRTTCQHGPCQ